MVAHKTGDCRGLAWTAQFLPLPGCVLFTGGRRASDVLKWHVDRRDQGAVSVRRVECPLFILPRDPGQRVAIDAGKGSPNDLNDQRAGAYHVWHQSKHINTRDAALSVP